MKIYILSVLTFFLFSSCSSSESEVPLEAAFTISESSNGANYRLIKNTTVANYALSEWDFGNGQTAENVDSITVYYPQAGEYTVTLDLWENGRHSETSNTVSIANNDEGFSFSIVASDDYNYTLVNNTTIALDGDITWTVSDMGSATAVDTLDLYLGLKGDYLISMSATIDGEAVSVSQSITINEDDTDYWNNVELSWSDEFEGNTVNSNNWTFETGDNGWGNNEWQNYTDGDNSTVSDGQLHITVKKEGAGQNVGDYTSSRMISKGKQIFTYGRVEVRADIPDDKGNGLWPAIWMLGENISEVGWPACGEIDIMEHVSFQPNYTHSAIHNTSSYGNTVNTSGDYYLETIEEQFHNYGILWTKDKIQFYIDDVDNVIYTYNPSVKNDTTWPFYQPQFILLNIAVGGDWGGAHGVDDSIFPNEMVVDYVRVYQHNIALQ